MNAFSSIADVLLQDTINNFITRTGHDEDRFCFNAFPNLRPSPDLRFALDTLEMHAKAALNAQFGADLSSELFWHPRGLAALICAAACEPHLRPFALAAGGVPGERTEALLAVADALEHVARPAVRALETQALEELDSAVSHLANESWDLIVGAVFQQRVEAREGGRDVFTVDLNDIVLPCPYGRLEIITALTVRDIQRVLPRAAGCDLTKLSVSDHGFATLHLHGDVVGLPGERAQQLSLGVM